MVIINKPSTPTAPEAWNDPEAIATVVPEGALPESLNGILFSPWDDAPKTDLDLEDAEGQEENLVEPVMDLTSGKTASAGVVIEEPVPWCPAFY